MLKLKVGKTYVTHDGRRVTISGFDPFYQEYMAEEPDWANGIGRVLYFKPDGESANGGYLDDLLAEAPDPADAPANPSCPTRFRLKTAEQLGTDDVRLQRYGGQVSSIVKPGSGYDLGQVFLIFGNDVVGVPAGWVEQVTDHSFPDTGTKKSWCSCCGVVGHFDWRSGKFSA